MGAARNISIMEKVWTRDPGTSRYFDPEVFDKRRIAEVAGRIHRITHPLAERDTERYLVADRHCS